MNDDHQSGDILHTKVEGPLPGKTKTFGRSPKIKGITQLPTVNHWMKRVDAEPRSMRTVVVRKQEGKYAKDVASLSVRENGEVEYKACYWVSVEEAALYAPSEAESESIRREAQDATWPQLKPLFRLSTLPPDIENADSANVFEFRNLRNEIVMLQLRTMVKDERKYVPWTFWDDNEWRKMEPEGALPLWGIDQLKNHTTVFIHEGAKAARAMRRMVEAKTADAKAKLKAHPWGEELSAAAHVGWIGGAYAADRTDWRALKKAGVKRAYIVSDNDPPGVAAVPSIAFQLRIPTFHVQFTNEWPSGFDLADEFPEKMFREIEGKRYYTGPSFVSCLHPATWATDQIANKKGKPSTVLREHFKDMWAYVEEADLFVCVEMPEILRPESILNKMLAGFSHSNNLSALIVRSYRGRSTKLCYRPDTKGRIVTDRNTSAINLHTPTTIKATPGSPKPFLEFMDYMFPSEGEREEVKRWCATLIARPDMRMEYGLLLVSEKQGVGKTTLGSSILAPLVGLQNVSYPTESEIVDSNFNGWLANKRLVIVNEIYSGHSWKAYNKLKSLITDPEVTVNEKYQRPYVVENWCHMFACSNSLRALKMEEDDRRWFYPAVTEVQWPREKFVELHSWVRGGGLGIIRAWAETFEGRYVEKGQRVPMTVRKKDLIDDSRSEAYALVRGNSARLCEDGCVAVFTTDDVLQWVKGHIREKVHDRASDMGKALRDGGMIYVDRMTIRGSKRYVYMTPMAERDVKARAITTREPDSREEESARNARLREIMDEASVGKLFLAPM